MTWLGRFGVTFVTNKKQSYVGLGTKKDLHFHDTWDNRTRPIVKEHVESCPFVRNNSDLNGKAIAQRLCQPMSSLFVVQCELFGWAVLD